jgi:hypothetical protein
MSASGFLGSLEEANLDGMITTNELLKMKPN